MNYRAICFGLPAFFLLGSVPARAQGRFEVSPFVGFETSGSYPLASNSNVIITNPIDRLRANQATSYGTFLGYNLTENAAQYSPRKAPITGAEFRELAA